MRSGLNNCRVGTEASYRDDGGLFLSLAGKRRSKRKEHCESGLVEVFHVCGVFVAEWSRRGLKREPLDPSPSNLGIKSNKIVTSGIVLGSLLREALMRSPIWLLW